MKFAWDGFEPEDMVEESAIASVWTARQLAPSRRVLVKHIAPFLLPTPSARETFRQRAHELGRLQHPGLVRLHEALVQGEDVLLVTARREGITLDKRLLRDGTVSERKALEIAEGLARILQHAWEREWWIDGWLHPARIAEDADGHVFILDFAVTRLLLESTSVDEDARQKAIGAAEYYLAPEQLLIKPSTEVVSDIYAVGAILYHAVSGTKPFGDVHGDYLRDKHLYEQLDDPRAHQPNLSSGFLLLLEKMLIRDRRARPDAWKIILSDIEAVRAGGQPAGPRPAPGQSVLRYAAAPPPSAPYTPPRLPKPGAPKVEAALPQTTVIPVDRPAANRPAAVPPPSLPTFPPPPPAAGMSSGGLPDGLSEEPLDGPQTTRMPRQIVLSKEDIARLQQGKKRRKEISVLVLLVLALAGTATYGLIQQNPKAAAVWQDVALWAKDFWQKLAKTVEEGRDTQAEMERIKQQILSNKGKISEPREDPGTSISTRPVRPTMPPGTGTPSAPPTGTGTRPSTGTAPQAPGTPSRPRPPSPPPNPLFLEGAQHFNAALELFERFQQTRDASLLAQVEKRAQAAQVCFERYQQEAPQDGRVAKYIDQCYGMVRYARQSALQSGGASHPRVTPTRPEPTKPTRSSALDRIREMEAQKERGKRQP